MDWGDNGTIYEEGFNRAIINSIIKELSFLGIPYVITIMPAVLTEVFSRTILKNTPIF